MLCSSVRRGQLYGDTATRTGKRASLAFFLRWTFSSSGGRDFRRKLATDNVDVETQRKRNVGKSKLEEFPVPLRVFHSIRLDKVERELCDRVPERLVAAGQPERLDEQVRPLVGPQVRHLVQ
jgi:hypothetical protein